jgi:Toxin with endonuclease activity, of toxin-antitoxin system
VSRKRAPRPRWQLFAHPAFSEPFDALVNEVERLRKADPQGYKDHPKAKMLRRIIDLIEVEIPRDPGAPEYGLGNDGARRAAREEVTHGGLAMRPRALHLLLRPLLGRRRDRPRWRCEYGAHALSRRGRIFMRRAPDRRRALRPKSGEKSHSIQPVKPDSAVWHKA